MLERGLYEDYLEGSTVRERGRNKRKKDEEENWVARR